MASIVVGALANSKIIFAFISLTFSLLICFERAAGMRMSQSLISNSSFDIFRLPGKLMTVPVWFLCSITVSMSRPSVFRMPPLESLTAQILYPSLYSICAAFLPTFPNPWIAILIVSFSMSVLFNASSSTQIPPRDVAMFRTLLPPNSTGFPVTMAGTCFPLIFSNSSSIQTIIWLSV